MAELPVSNLRSSDGFRRTLLIYIQAPSVLACIGVVLVTSQSSNAAVLRNTAVIAALLIAITVIALLVPWQRFSANWLILVAVADFVIFGFLREAALFEELGLNVLSLIPVLWLCYFFKGRALIIAFAGILFVALFPFVGAQTWPATTAEWGNAILLPAIVAVVAVAVHFAANSLRQQQEDLVRAYEELRLSVEEGVVGAEALRVSVAKGVVGAEALRLSVAKGAVGAEALRVSVAKAKVGAEALRVSVAQGLDAASAALAVVDTVDAGITFYDVDGVVLLTNDTARELAFYGRATAAADSTTPLIYGADRHTPIPEIDQIVARAARGELVTRRAYWMGAGEEQRALMATSQFVRRASGELIGTVVATHDVTPLAAAIRSRDEFLTTISHELRTPLTSVIGYLELIEDSIDVTALGIDDEFSIVQRNSHRLLGLINDLLTTAEGQASIERRPFNITELVENSVRAASTEATSRQIQILTPLLVPVIAEVDADRIGDVLDKLLSNAIKFNHPGGQVTVEVEGIGDEAVVRIADTGIGIEPGDLERIFERFFRSSTARAGEVAGSGLGLSTAKVIVDSHLGTMTVASDLGRGTTIELRLPVAVAAAHQSSAHTPPTAGWTLT